MITIHSTQKIPAKQVKNLTKLAEILHRLMIEFCGGEEQETLESFSICESISGKSFGITIESSMWYSILTKEFGHCQIEDKLDAELKAKGLYKEEVNSWLLGAWEL